MSESTGAASPVVTVATNSDGWFTSVSPGFLALIGQPVEALAGVNVVDLVHPLDAAGARGLIAAASVGPEATVRFLAANDQWSPMRVRTTALPDGRVQLALAPVPTAAAPPSVLAPEQTPGPGPGDGAVVGDTPGPGDSAVVGDTPGPGDSAVVGDTARVDVGSVDPLPAVAPVATAAPLAAELVATSPTADPVRHADTPASEAQSALLASTINEGFHYPADDSVDYVASRPDSEVAGQRAAVRAAASTAGAIAMLEVDTSGQTVFIEGDWPSVVAGDHSDATAAVQMAGETVDSKSAEHERPADSQEAHPAGLPASKFEQLLGSTGQGRTVLSLVHQAIQPGQPGDAIVHVYGRGLRHIRVEPIASPLLAGVTHALVTVAPAPAGATVTAVGDPTWTMPMTAMSTTATGADEASADGHARDEAHRTETDAEAQAEASASAQIEPETRRSRWWIWAALAALAVVLLWALFGRSDDATSEMGPVDVEIVPSDSIEIEPGQNWRTLGVPGLSDVHGIAATADGALVASLTGSIITVDESGLAQSVVVVGDPAMTVLSDVTATADGTSWALDAGLSQIYRVSPDGDVTILEPNAGELRNARGIALGRDDTVWIASTASASLVQIGRDGGIILTLPFPGRQPSDVVELDDGTLWFVDADQIELVHITDAGETISTLPIEGFFSNESPHLAVVDNVLWVTEPNQASVFAVDLTMDEPTGERISLARPQGERVERPIGLSASQDGRLWTVDSLGRAVIILDN